MQCIIGLSTIHGVDPTKIHESHEKLTSHIQVLETMGKVKEIGRFMCATLNKLPDILADLVGLDDDWQEWGFPELIESLRKWCDHNPIPSKDQILAHQTAIIETMTHRPAVQQTVAHLSAVQQTMAHLSAVYQTMAHLSMTRQPGIRQIITLETTIHQRKILPTKPRIKVQRLGVSVFIAMVKIIALQSMASSLTSPSLGERLIDKKLCFNCTDMRHQAQECRNNNACQHCGNRHHISICDRLPGNNQMMLVTGDHERSVLYPVVVVLVDGNKCGALLDTVVGCSHASAALIKRLNKHPTHVEHKQMEMILCSTIQKVLSYTVKVASVNGKFEMTTKVNKVDKAVLLTVSNPHYEELISKYPHLEGVVWMTKTRKMNCPSTSYSVPVSTQESKPRRNPRIGKPSEPIGELTMLGWVTMSSGKEADLYNIYLTNHQQPTTSNSAV